MLRNFAAALLATTLIAGPALAAQPSNSAGAPAATTNMGTRTVTKQVKHVKSVKHARRHSHRQVAHAKTGTTKTTKIARHFKATKTHRGHLAHVVKPVNGSHKAS